MSYRNGVLRYLGAYDSKERAAEAIVDYEKHMIIPVPAMSSSATAYNCKGETINSADSGGIMALAGATMANQARAFALEGRMIPAYSNYTQSVRARAGGLTRTSIPPANHPAAQAATVFAAQAMDMASSATMAAPQSFSPSPAHVLPMHQQQYMAQMVQAMQMQARIQRQATASRGTGMWVGAETGANAGSGGVSDPTHAAQGFLPMDCMRFLTSGYTPAHAQAYAQVQAQTHAHHMSVSAVGLSVGQPCSSASMP